MQVQNKMILQACERRQVTSEEHLDMARLIEEEVDQAEEKRHCL